MIKAGIQVYFYDDRSPSQRRTNDNTNGLLRQYFSKGTDLSAHGADVLAAIAMAPDTHPRGTQGWGTPAEALWHFREKARTGFHSHAFPGSSSFADVRAGWPEMLEQHPGGQLDMRGHETFGGRGVTGERGIHDRFMLPV